MASTSTGTYSVKLTGDSSQFQAEMAKVAEASKATAIQIRSTSTELNVVSGSGKNATFAIQQLALGVQDAASVFGTSGFAGAMRAAGNNIIQFASLLSPIAGTVAAFALTGVQLMADSFNKASKATTEATQALLIYGQTAAKIERDVRQEGELRKIGGMTDPKQLLNEAKESDDRALQARQRVERGTAEIANIQNLMDETRARMSRNPSIRDRFGGGGMTIEAGQTRLEQLQKELDSQRAAVKEAEIIQRESEERAQEARRAGLGPDMRAGFEVDIKAFQEAKRNQDERDAKQAADKAKAAIRFEDERQKLIAGSNRDMMADEEQRRARLRAYDPFTSAAGFGSSSAAEALARARAVPKEQTDIDRQVLAIQQKALSELSEIRLNTKAKAAPAVVEEFD